MDINIRRLLVFVVISFFTRISADTPLGCDEGWVQNNNYCYRFYNTKAVTWQQASDECNRYDSSLLYFDNIAEETWFTAYINATPTTVASYWTALNDIPLGGASGSTGNGNWKWGRYSTADPSLITWQSSPGNDGKANCGGVNLQGKMSDIDCNSKQGYLCNIELPPDASGGCPIGWLPTDTDCYWVSNTTNPSQLLTWNDAKTKCSNLATGAHLVTIDDVNDQAFVQQQLPYFTKNAYLHWTGLQYTNGQWQWYNGARFNQALFQWANEPDNVAGNESCAVVRANGKFSDRNCQTQQHFICKKSQDYSSNSFNLGCDIWTRAGQYCYMFFKGPLSTWQAARQNCRSIQGDLINVKDIDTQTWLSEQMLVPSIQRNYWTGLTDSAKEGSYVWTDGTPMDSNIIYWNQEPNDYMGQEDCGLLKANGYYNDVSCSVTKAAAVCELDNTPSCPTRGGQWVSRKADYGPNNNCYLFTAYNNASVLFLQSEAKSYCNSLGIDTNHIPFLLSVDSLNEKAFIRAQLKNYIDNPYGYHTSLNDRQSEGFWTFANTKAMGDQTNLIDWSGEPNNQTADTDCVNVNYGGYYEVKKCSDKQSFICQRPVGLAWTTAAAGTLTLQNFVLASSLILSVLVRQ